MDEWLAFLEQHSFHVLRNENKKIYGAANKEEYICLAGVDDVEADRSL